MWYSALGVGVLLLVLLYVLLCCRSPPRRKLCFLLCTHPNPAMGPLYMPEEMRAEYAAALGLKRPPPLCLGVTLLCCLGAGLGTAAAEGSDGGSSTSSNGMEDRLAATSTHGQSGGGSSSGGHGRGYVASQIVDSAATTLTVTTAAVCSAQSTAAQDKGGKDKGRFEQMRPSRLLAHSNPAIGWFYQPPEKGPRLPSRALSARDEAMAAACEGDVAASSAVATSSMPSGRRDGRLMARGGSGRSACFTRAASAAAVGAVSSSIAEVDSGEADGSGAPRHVSPVEHDHDGLEPPTRVTGRPPSGGVPPLTVRPARCPSSHPALARVAAANHAASERLHHHQLATAADGERAAVGSLCLDAHRLDLSGSGSGVGVGSVVPGALLHVPTSCGWGGGFLETLDEGGSDSSCLSTPSAKSSRSAGRHATFVSTAAAGGGAVAAGGGGDSTGLYSVAAGGGGDSTGLYGVVVVGGGGVGGVGSVGSVGGVGGVGGGWRDGSSSGAAGGGSSMDGEGNFRERRHHHHVGRKTRLTREEKEALASLQLELNRAASGFVQQELERHSTSGLTRIPSASSLFSDGQVRSRLIAPRRP